MNRRLTPLTAALLAAFSAPLVFQASAHAQTAQAGATLPEVTVRDNAARNNYAPATSTVGGKTPTPLRDIPQSVTVINRAVLAEQAANSMTEALRNVPGITISAGEGGNIGDNINLRGFSARTDIFLDGLRDPGQYTRDTFSTEAVEVLRGPSSMLFGRGSTGGVINRVSKKPNLKPSGEVGISVGTDDYYRATLDLNRPLSETSAFRINAVGHENKSTRDVVENKRYGVAPSLRFGIGTPTEITLSALIQRSDDIPDYGFPVVGGKPANAPVNRYYGFTDDRFDQDVDIFRATIKHKFSPNLTLQNNTQYSKYKTDASPTPLSLIGTPTAATPLSAINANFNTRERLRNDEMLFNQTDLIAKLPVGSMLHTLTTGVEFGRDEFSNDTFNWTGLGSVNLGNPVYGPKPASAVRTRNTLTETTANTAALYVNDQIDLNKQWKLVGGLRWDRFSADQSVLTYATNARTQLSRTDKMLSTRAGVIWQPTEAASYYVSYGTSFNPSAESLSLSATSANLEPEKNRSLEVGAKLDLLNGNLSLNGALFRVEKTNARTTDPLTGIQTLDGDIRVQGLELGVVGRITPAWQVLAGYTLLDGKVVNLREVSGGIPAAGKTLSNTPRHSASLWSTYSFLGNWEAGGGVIYSSKRYLNNFETAQTDGYTRFDATVAYKQKDYDIRLNLQNLTDRKYFETASGGRATPVTGRAAIVSVAYRF